MPVCRAEHSQCGLLLWFYPSMEEDSVPRAGGGFLFVTGVECIRFPLDQMHCGYCVRSIVDVNVKNGPSEAIAEFRLMVERAVAGCAGRVSLWDLFIFSFRKENLTVGIQPRIVTVALSPS